MSTLKMDPRHVLGAKAEHLAVAYLLERNFSVARNAMDHGPYDLIAIKFYGANKRKTIFIDVKCVYHDPKGFPKKRLLSKEQQEYYGVVPLYVWPSGQIDFEDPTNSLDFDQNDYDPESDEPALKLPRPLAKSK